MTKNRVVTFYYKLVTISLTNISFSAIIDIFTLQIVWECDSVTRNLQKIIFIILFCGLAFAFSQAALATDQADLFRTTDSVRFRTGPSTDASIIKTVNTGTNVQIVEHDPAGWSKVKINDTTGFIRSDFLKVPTGTPLTLSTIGGVNLRSGPSTDTRIVKTLNPGTSVDVLDHDPAGWSNVTINGSSGYIRSDLLVLPGHVATTGTSVAQAPTTLKTVGGVNFRAEPSTDARIINVLNTGTSVEVMEYNPDGWSKVRSNGSTGYIRSDLLGEGAGSVELLSWSDAKDIVRTGVNMRVVDVRTGSSFTLRCFSKGGHADVEPVTQADTDTISRTRDGTWSWAARPVWVTIGNRTLAASMNGMPHAGSTISNNGMNGHLCLHFWGTITNNKSYEKDLNNAVMEAFNAGR